MATYDTGWIQFNNLWDGRIQCTETKQDIANNKTTAKFSLQLRWTDIATTTHCDGKYSMTIDGTTYNYTYSDSSFNVSNGTIITVFSKEVTITHNTDGSKSVPVSATLNITSFGYNTISNKSITLTKIPRASSFTLNVSSATIGSTQITVSISRASSSFTHKVYYSCGSNHNWQANSGNEGATSVSWTPAIADCNYYPNSTSGTATIIVDTYSGSTKIGTASKTLTLNVPSSVVPSISSLSVSENGGSEFSGVFVKGKSKANVSISASGSYSSTITSYSTTVTGQSARSGSSFTTDLLNTVGTITFTTTIKDSRGRTASKSTTISVYDYDVPKFSLSATRSNAEGEENLISGTYIKFTYGVSSYSDIGSRNILNYKVYVRNITLNGAKAEKVSGTGLKDSTSSTVTSDYKVNEAYEVIMEVTDQYGTYTKTVNIPIAYALMDFKQGGKGIAIGTLATLEDTLEVNLEGQFNRALKTTRGTYCHQAGGKGGENGYIKFCTLKVIGEYANSPLVIKVGRRKDQLPKELIISFESIGGSTDPGLVNFNVRGTTGDFFIHKSASSTYDLYAKKNESWDNIGVFDIQMSKYLADRLEVRWHDGAQVSDLPSGYIAAAPYNSFLIPGNGNWFNGGTPIVGTDGGTEIGKYLDFHQTNGETSDYGARLATWGGGTLVNYGAFVPNTTNNSNYTIGTSNNRWYNIYLNNQPNVSSDRTLKENITYVKSEKAKSTQTDEIVTYEDMYDFVKNDLELATYNFIGQEEQNMNFIAQDLLYNLDGTDNKIGQMIINPVAPPTKEEIEEAKAKLEEGQEYNYPTLSYDMGMYISVLAGALKNAINEIETLKLEIKELRGEK